MRTRAANITLGPRVLSKTAIIREWGQQSRNLTEYTDSTSWFRVFAVCSLTLTPAFVITILIELLRLRPPSEGWKANWVFWIRLFVSCFALSVGIGVQVTKLIPAASLAAQHAVFIGFSASVGYVLPIIALARCWRFPVPFSIVVGYPSWHLSLSLSLFLVIGAKRLRKVPDIKKQVIAARPLAFIQAALIVIYSAYNALFLRLHGSAQIAFVLVRPVFKYFMNWILGRYTVRIPSANVFGLVTVRLFDALYQFKCMQSAGSMTSGVVIIGVDLIENIYHLRNAHKRIKSVRQDLEKTDISANYKQLVQKAVIRVTSGRRSHRFLGVNPTEIPANTIAPLPESQTKGPSTTEATSMRTLSKLQALSTDAESMRLDENIHVLLFECERLMVTEFIECAVPMLYAMYLSILFHLPNARFYPELHSLDTAKLSHAVQNIATYAMLEFVSLLYMHLLLYWELQISAMHLLANILERENVMLQGVFITWVIVVLQFTLQHGGIDDSFNFG